MLLVSHGQTQRVLGVACIDIMQATCPIVMLMIVSCLEQRGANTPAGGSPGQPALNNLKAPTGAWP